jgi:hypothetical protein
MKTTNHTATDSDLCIMRLRGGVASDAIDAVCVDLDPGSVEHEWSALVRRDRIANLLHNTGAEQVGEARIWYGETFGDGNGGTVTLVAGTVAGSGLNAAAL